MPLIYAGGRWRNVPDSAKANVQPSNAKPYDPLPGLETGRPPQPQAQPEPGPAFLGATPPHTPPSPPPAPYVPPPPPPGQDSVNYTPVKIPDAEVVVFLQDQVSADALEKLYFEDVGGTEILAVARHDTVGGEPVATAPISNLEDIKLQFNPLNILSSINSDELFNQFAIDMNTHIYDTNNAVYGETMWIDDTSSYQKHLVVEVDDLKEDEYIQIQVAGNTVEYEIYDESWYNGSGGTP